MSGATQRFSLGFYRVFTHTGIQFHYGDRLAVTGTVDPDLLLSFPEVELLQREALFKPLVVLNQARQAATKRIRETVPEPHASLVTGMVLGEQSGMPRRFREALIATGTIHVVVASGMNVNLLTAAVFSLAGFISRRKLLIISSLVILLYMGSVGFDPPIVRASAMSFFSMAALALGKQREAWWSLLLTVAILLLVEPLLIRSLSFQLSVAATVGVLAGGMMHGVDRPVPSRAHGLVGPLKRVFMNDLVMTVAAQLSVLPILVHSFHRVSLVAPLLNALILWTVAPLMLLGAAAGILLSFVPSLMSVFSWLLWPPAHLFVSVVRVGAHIPGATIIVPPVPVWMWMVYYAVLVLVLVKWRMGAKSN